MSRQGMYNPWQERLDRVTEEIREQGRKYRENHPEVKHESLQDKFDRVCNSRG